MSTTLRYVFTGDQLEATYDANLDGRTRRVHGGDDYLADRADRRTAEAIRGARADHFLRQMRQRGRED